MNDRLEEHARRIAELHRCHTVILYGSHARGDATEHSDIDLLCVRDGGARMRDARLTEGTYLDAFIYPTQDLASIDASLLRIAGGRLLRDDRGFGAQLLVRVQALYDRGPEPLPEDERAARVL